jgi:hypothetical protein
VLSHNHIWFSYLFNFIFYFFSSLIAEVGDYDASKHTYGYVSEFRLVPNQTKELEYRIGELHKQLKGIGPPQAEFNYLDKVKWLDMYGVDLHPVLVRKNMVNKMPINAAIKSAKIFFLNNSLCWLRLIITNAVLYPRLPAEKWSFRSWDLKRGKKIIIFILLLVFVYYGKECMPKLS